MTEHDDRMEAFGEFIRAQRKLANLSLRQLGSLSGVSDSYLSQMERGMYRASPEVISNLARAFGIPASVLYSQFGLLGEESERVEVEAAIHADPALSQEQKRALLLIYRAFVPKESASPKTV